MGFGQQIGIIVLLHTFIALVAVTTILSADGTIEIHNVGEVYVLEVYIKESVIEEWGENRLLEWYPPDPRIQPGGRSAFLMPAGVYDLKLVDAEGQECFQHEANVTDWLLWTVGTDGDFSNLHSWPEIDESMIIYHDGSITDTQTGLTWLVNESDDVTRGQASRWIRSLCEGEEEWRFPTSSELIDLALSGYNTTNWGPFGPVGRFIWTNRTRPDGYGFTEAEFVIMYPQGSYVWTEWVTIVGEGWCYDCSAFAIRDE